MQRFDLGALISDRRLEATFAEEGSLSSSDKLLALP